MIIEWFDFFVDLIGDVVRWGSTWYIFGTISLFDFLVVCIVSGMLINVFVAKGSD